MSEQEIRIKVIDESLALLDKPHKWKHESIFKEDCPPTLDKYTLGCALQKAQLIHRGEIQNRSKEMSITRRKIYRHFFWRAGIHPITYFNRHKSTNYQDIIFILGKVKDKLM